MNTIYLLFLILVLVLLSAFMITKYFGFSTISEIILIVIFAIIIFMFLLINGQKKVKKNNQLEINIASKLNNSYVTNEVDSSTVPVEVQNMINLIRQLSHFSPVKSKIEILENGEKTFDSLFREISKATHHIHIEDYTIRDDEIGTRFLDLLISKAKQGVKVRIITDGIGEKMSYKTLRKLRSSGIEIYIKNPIFKSIMTGEINTRDHRKIFIVDGRIAFTGGINIGDEYIGKRPELGLWRDTDIRIEGDAVKQLQCIFLSSWYVNKGNKLEGSEYFPNTNEKYEEICQTVNGLPEGNSSVIEYVYTNMINTAKKSISITTPYLVLNEKTYNALISAKLRGVDINIIIPSYSDNFIANYATIYYSTKLMDHGIRVYKYDKGFIHSKIISIDDSFGSVGTANFNNRSLNLDYENCLLIYDVKTMSTLNSHFKKDITDSKLLDLSDSSNRKFFDKLIERFLIIFSSIE